MRNPFAKAVQTHAFRTWSVLVLMFCSSVEALATNVMVKTDIGDFEIELFDEQTPLTVANFLKYVSDGDYNGTFLHRSLPGFVLQGGGFSFAEGSVTAVATDPPVQNEPGISNTVGTIAMAKIADDPDSATSQWFINLADNSATLDTQNGGFTVFGQVTGEGMDVVREIEALRVWDAGAPFDNLPLIDYPGSPAPVGSDELVELEIEILNDFLINAGLNDAWVHDGAGRQGMFITVFPELKIIFLAWFTFDSSVPDDDVTAEFGAAGQRWVTALGTYEGNRAELNAELTTGGIFNADNPLPTQDTGYGTIILEFENCKLVHVSYEFPLAGESGQFDAGRVLEDSVPRCEALSQATP